MYERILVPVDGSPVSRLGLEQAIEMARLTGASVRVLHVLDDLVFVTGMESGATYARDVLPRMRAAAERLLNEARGRAVEAGIVADSMLAECYARRTADVILESARAWKADLIVIGTHGRRGASRFFMGSDAEQVVRGAEVPVLLVRGSDVAKAPGKAAQAVEAV